MIHPGERRECRCGKKVVGARTISGKIVPMTLEPDHLSKALVGLGPAPETCTACDGGGCAICGDRGAMRQPHVFTPSDSAYDAARAAGLAFYSNHANTCSRARELVWTPTG
jgi:hypothetical protein